MRIIRPIDLATDLPMLQAWWAGHGSVPCPESFLPQGWLVTAGGVDIAAAFLYLDVGGKIAAIEYLTTNPAVAFSRFLVDDVRRLVAHIEEEALKRGATCLLSFVKPDTGEERLYRRLGFTTDDGPSHKIWGKRLTAPTKEGA